VPNIEIKVAGKIATNTTPDVVLVCGNSDYTVTFDLDEEWAAERTRTVRFSYIRDGKKIHKEHTFEGNTVAVPKLSGVRQVTVGLYAGDLHTTTPAVIWCKLSILCGDSVEEITQEEKAGIQSELDRLALLIDGLAEITPAEKDEIVTALANLSEQLADLTERMNGMADLAPEEKEEIMGALADLTKDLSGLSDHVNGMADFTPAEKKEFSEALNELTAQMENLSQNLGALTDRMNGQASLSPEEKEQLETVLSSLTQRVENLATHQGEQDELAAGTAARVVELGIKLDNLTAQAESLPFAQGTDGLMLNASALPMEAIDARIDAYIKTALEGDY
jgi:chromosome segregation ATPase